MTANNPCNTVEVLVTKDLCIATHDVNICAKAGETVMLQKQHLAHCYDAVVVADTADCPDRVWMVTLQPGEQYKAENPDGVLLCVKSTADLSYIYATETKPLTFPGDEVEIKENAPALLSAGEHSLPLVTGEGEDVTAIGFVNCSDAVAKIEITWKGCNC